MEKITLTAAQKARIIERLADYHDGVQDFEFDEDFGGGEIAVTVRGWIETRCHCEDDRENGTGAWVEDYRSADVTITGQRYDPATNDLTDVEIDDGGEAYRFLNAA